MLDIRLGTRLVGSLVNLSGDYTLFTFDEDYAADDERPVLSQAFVGTGGSLITRPRQTQIVAPPFFANLLPEAGGVLRELVARQYHLDPARDFPFLRALGSDLPGAVIAATRDATSHDASPGFPGTTSDGEPLLRFSLAGVQAKFSAGMIGERLTIATDGADGAWIVKLPTNRFARLPENERHVMTLAARIGLAVPDHGVVPLDRIDGLPSDTSRLGADEPHVAYIVRRFDRTADGRVHGEDFNQIADARPRAKYDGHPCEWIARVTAALCSTADVEELVRRLVFGVCVGNGDMHLKNWGVQYPDTRNARLAPMYDFVCTRAYIEDDALALSLGGETRFSRIDRDALERFADGAELSKRRVVTLARETVDRLHDAWAVLKPTIDDTTFTAAIDRNFALTPIARNR